MTYIVQDYTRSNGKFYTVRSYNDLADLMVWFGEFTPNSNPKKCPLGKILIESRFTGHRIQGRVIELRSNLDEGSLQIIKQNLASLDKPWAGG